MMIPRVLIVLMMSQLISSQAVFSSTEEMGKILRLEKQLVEEMTKHSEELEMALNSIEEYVSQVTEVYSSSCPEGECTEEMTTERIIGNPIYNYQLLKRITVYWSNVEQAIGKVDKKGTLARMKKLKSKHRKLPTEEDLKAAAKAINKLQDVYSIEPDKLVMGNIGDISTGAELSLGDTYYLARMAAVNNNPGIATSLAEQAIVQATAAQNSSLSDRPSVQVQSMRQLLAQQRKKVQHSTGKETFPLGLIPPKTNDRAKMTTEQDKKNFHALCRGQDILPARYRKHLNCFYSTRNDPYFTIHPVAVEVIHKEPHEVLVFHHILSDKESDTIRDLTHKIMKQSAIGQDKTVSDLRLSENAWIEDGKHPLVDKISQRTNWVTGLQTSKIFDRHGEGKKEEYEYLQLARYGIGGYYDAHQDPLFVYKDHNYIARSVEATGPASYNTGDRMSTLMFYLSDVTKGGYTAFPRLGVFSPPVKGSAVFWHNIKRSGWSDMAMLHGGCPVLLGSKVVANKWIREVANMFHRKC